MLFAQWRIDKAVAKSAKALVGGQDAELTLPAIHALPEKYHYDALLQLGEALRQEEAFDLARRVLNRAIEVRASDTHGLRLLTKVELEDGRTESGLALLYRAHALEPDNETLTLELADLLLESEQVDDALELLGGDGESSNPEVVLLVAKALAARGEDDRALPLVRSARDAFEWHLKRSTSSGAWQRLRDKYQEATHLWSELQAQAEGAESVVEADALAGRLDGKAGVNYRLLGATLASRSPRVAIELELRSPSETEERAKSLLAADPRSAHGMVLLGSARLRAGQLGEARRLFDRARSVDGDFFPALLGLGAALDLDRHGCIARCKKLPEPENDLGILSVVPDWPALTPLETRVVATSVRPLRAWLDRVAARGARIRVLPLDVRPTDLPELNRLTGQRTDDDYRSYDAIGGLATASCAVARVEGLLDTSPTGWTFAHELAHLVFFSLPDEWQDRFSALLDETCAQGYVAAAYDQKNVDEFFACSYTDYLCVRHDIPLDREVESGGVVERTFDAIDRLGRHSDLDLAGDAPTAGLRTSSHGTHS
ncbi:MAG: tetratricopeptide repeat protein [Deltaproteobacteria bacterium]|nr:tetratricopeptide repeat protein [Deltaproteobacteria bacterium]